MSKKITIAIDGHSSTGKSTAARELANHLDYLYVDSGAMYRAVSLYALQNGLVNDGRLDQSGLIERLDKIHIELRNSAEGRSMVFLNGNNVTTEIRTMAVSGIVSPVATIPEVRRKLVEQQQAMGINGGVVMDGRDIGTVVFPHAEMKVFMTATPRVRAERRYAELKKAGHDILFDEVYNNVVARDRIDSARDTSPLIQAEDAFLLDTSQMSRIEQFDLLKQWALQAIRQKTAD
jgi:cytidylate kinase